MNPLIFMVHGAFCGGWAFDQFASWFQTHGYDTLCPDLPYHDAGPHQAPDPRLGQTGLTDYCDTLAAELDALDRDVILMGHSMGGLLCQMLAARGYGQAIVLVAPSAPWGVMATSTFEMMSAQGLALAGGQWQSALHPTFALAAEHALDRLSTADQHAVFSRFVPESRRAMSEILHWPADPNRASAVLARAVQCPVLCLAGGRDRVNPAATVRLIAARYRSRAHYQCFDEMSHWMIGEPGWQDVAETTHGWLEEAGLGPNSQSG